MACVRARPIPGSLTTRILSTHTSPQATVISGGLTNALWALHPPQPAPPVAARAFGDGSDLLVDRRAERAALAALNPAGFGAAVLAHFPGGRLEELLAMRTLTADDVAEPTTAARIAAGLARLHAAGRGLAAARSGGGHGGLSTAPRPIGPGSAAAAHAALFTTMRAWLAMALRIEAVAVSGGAGKDGKVPPALARAAARAATPSPAPLPPGGALHGLSIPALSAAIDRWEAATAPLASRCGPAVLCHMDLLPGNIMVEDGVGVGAGEGAGAKATRGGGPALANSSGRPGPAAGKDCAAAAADPAQAPPSPSSSPAPPLLHGPGPGMQFIDFEYARPAPRGFDLGNHWCEWAGLDCDWARYPSAASKAAFAAAYLAEAVRWAADGGGGEKGRAGAAAPAAAPPPPSPAAVAALVVEGDAYAQAAHLWWTAWALVQARVSPIDFDYGAYAASRFACFEVREDGVRAAVEGLVRAGRARAGWRRAFCVGR